MNRVSFSLIVLVLSPAFSAADVINDRDSLNLILGDNFVLEDFESFELPDEQAEPLDVFLLDAGTVTNGQGPGLVESGATYLDPSETRLQWNGHNWFGLQTKSLNSSSPDGELLIIYDTPMLAMGIDLRAFEGFGWDGVVDIYGTNDTLLGSVPVSVFSGGDESVFIGWEDLGGGGITRVELTSPDRGWSPIIDNHAYGIPAPGTLPALALVGLSGRRLR